MVDKLDRIVISHRWVTESIKFNYPISTVKSMQLCPMPQKIPVQDFAKLVIYFTCHDKPENKELFEQMADLYGFTRKFRE